MIIPRSLKELAKVPTAYRRARSSATPVCVQSDPGKYIVSACSSIACITATGISPDDGGSWRMVMDGDAWSSAITNVSEREEDVDIRTQYGTMRFADVRGCRSDERAESDSRFPDLSLIRPKSCQTTTAKVSAVALAAMCRIIVSVCGRDANITLAIHHGYTNMGITSHGNNVSIESFLAQHLS